MLNTYNDPPVLLYSKQGDFRVVRFMTRFVFLKIMPIFVIKCDK